MTIEGLRQIYDRYQRRDLIDATTERIVTDHTVRYLLHAPKIAWITYSDFHPDDTEAVVTAEINFFKELGYELEWKCFDYDTSPDLKRHLLAQGFSEGEREAVMVLPIADAPETLRQPVSYDIRLATTAAMFADADKVYYDVWKDDPYTDASATDMSDWLLPRYQLHPDNLSLYIVYVNDVPVSYGRVEFANNNPFASIWGGSTLVEYRRKGIYTQLVAKRLQAAQARGCEYLTVDARSDTSMPILQKLGFMTLGYATAFNWSPE